MLEISGIERLPEKKMEKPNNTVTLDMKWFHQLAQKKVDVRDLENIEKTRILTKSLPTFWPQLVSICEIEKSMFLPDVGKFDLVMTVKMKSPGALNGLILGVIQRRKAVK